MYECMMQCKLERERAGREAHAMGLEGYIWHRIDVTKNLIVQR